jgi:hypothetical protein
MKPAVLSLILFFSCIMLGQCNKKAPFSPGIKIGNKIPDFRLADQVRRLHDFSTLCGREGLVIIFYRSADW